MQLDVYLIRGRGEKGDKFQLAMVKNATGDYFKGQYDPTLQFSNLTELKEMLGSMLETDSANIELNELNL